MMYYYNLIKISGIIPIVVLPKINTTGQTAATEEKPVETDSVSEYSHTYMLKNSKQRFKVLTKNGNNLEIQFLGRPYYKVTISEKDLPNEAIIVQD